MGENNYMTKQEMIEVLQDLIVPRLDQHDNKFALLDRKMDKNHKSLLGYIEYVEKELIAHRSNTEFHQVKAG